MTVLLYSGPNLGASGWLNGTMEDVPKVMTLQPPRRRFASAVLQGRTDSRQI
jgi:hypothetical protein